MLSRLQRNAILRQGSPVDDLAAFVQSERGRPADSDELQPLCLYFTSAEDRAEFMVSVQAARPELIVKASLCRA